MKEMVEGRLEKQAKMRLPGGWGGARGQWQQGDLRKLTLGRDQVRIGHEQAVWTGFLVKVMTTWMCCDMGDSRIFAHLMDSGQERAPIETPWIPSGPVEAWDRLHLIGGKKWDFLSTIYPVNPYDFLSCHQNETEQNQHLGKDCFTNLGLYSFALF